jgi:hypothetical protein
MNNRIVVKTVEKAKNFFLYFLPILSTCFVAQCFRDVIVIIDMFKGEGINCVRVRQRELKWRERDI